MATVADRTATLDPPLTVKEVSELLQISEPTIREWLRDGKIRGHRIGGSSKRSYRWRVPRSEVERLTT